jgi:hypothetical protein
MRAILIAIVFLMPLMAMSQRLETPFFYKKEIKFQGLGLAYGSFNMHYEKYSSKGNSINVNAYVFDFLYAKELKGFGIAAGYRDYFTPQLASSYFLEPFIKYQYMVEKGWNNSYVFNTNSIGIVLGRKLVIMDRLTLEFYLGPSVNFGFFKEGYKNSQLMQEWIGPINGIFIRSGLNIGYRFN